MTCTAGFGGRAGVAATAGARAVALTAASTTEFNEPKTPIAPRAANALTTLGGKYVPRRSRYFGDEPTGLYAMPYKERDEVISAWCSTWAPLSSVESITWRHAGPARHGRSYFAGSRPASWRPDLQLS